MKASIEGQGLGSKWGCLKTFYAKIRPEMQVSNYQTWDAGDTLSNSEFKTADSGCRRQYIRQRMQKSLYQTADAGDTLSDSICRSLSISQRMQESLNQTAVAEVSLSDSG